MLWGYPRECPKQTANYIMELEKYKVCKVKIPLGNSLPVLFCCYVVLQAPGTVYYIPNFISSEEGDSLWRQVGDII